MKKRKEIRKSQIKLIIKDYFIGLIIGIGCLIPGVSGGSLAVMLGIYDKVIYSISNFRKNISFHFSFLFILGTGILTSILLVSKFLRYLLITREVAVKYLFIGLIIGTVPSMISQIKAKKGFKMNWILFAISITVSLILKMVRNVYSKNIFSPFILIASGILYSAGKIIPGLSGSALLMLMGIYDYLLNIISNPFSITINEIKMLFPFIMSVICGLIILIKVVNQLIKKHYNKFYSVAIGLSLSSIIFLFPGFSFSLEYLLSLIISILGFILSYLLLT